MHFKYIITCNYQQLKTIQCLSLHIVWKVLTVFQVGWLCSVLCNGGHSIDRDVDPLNMPVFFRLVLFAHSLHTGQFSFMSLFCFNYCIICSENFMNSCYWLLWKIAIAHKCKRILKFVWNIYILFFNCKNFNFNCSICIFKKNYHYPACVFNN